MSTTTVANGRPRKQLADQLDRLDEQLERVNGVIDALAEGLNGAVNDAAREGVKAAVHGAVIELLTDSKLRATLHAASAEPKPSAWAGLKARVRQAATLVKEVAHGAAAVVADRVAAVGRAVASQVEQMRQAGPVRTAVRVLLGVGVLAAGVRYAAARGAGTLLASVRTIANKLTGRVGRWVRSALIPIWGA